MFLGVKVAFLVRGPDITVTVDDEMDASPGEPRSKDSKPSEHI